MRIRNHGEKIILRGFRVMLFGMVPKRLTKDCDLRYSFRVMLFRMVPKQLKEQDQKGPRFRAMLFRMAPKLKKLH